MYPSRSSPSRPGRRDSPARRLIWPAGVGLVAIAAAAFLYGAWSRSPGPPRPAANPEPAAAEAPLDTLAFRNLRPRQGDRMAPPRIGFRWTYQPASGGTDGVRYRLHLVGGDGSSEIVRDAAQTELNLDLAEQFPAGECAWWIEAVRADGTRARSRAERFLLTP